MTTSTLQGVEHMRLVREGDDYRVYQNGKQIPLDEWNFNEFEDYLTGKHIDEVARLVWTAAIAGWTLHVLSQESLTITSPDDKKSIGFSARRPPNRKIRAKIFKSIQEHGDPMRIAASQAYQWGADLPDFEMNVFFEQSKGREEKPVVRPPAQRTNEPYIVSEAPMMSHKSVGRGKVPGKRYPSNAIIEVKWSDGRTTYKCAKCGFVPKNPESNYGLRAHWQIHVRQDETLRRDEETTKLLLVEDPDYVSPVGPLRGYIPRKDTVEKLVDVIKGAKSKNFYEIAKAILIYEHENRAECDARRAEEYESLSAEETIEKIRALLDRGEYMEQRKLIDTQAEKMQSMSAELTSMREALEQAEAKAAETEKKYEDFKAWFELRPV